MNTDFSSKPTKGSAQLITHQQTYFRNLGVVDIAGSGPVHLLGGSSAFAAAIMLGPRLYRYEKGNSAPPMGNPVNACVGLFFLWWGWLAFNSGSTYGLSESKWEYAARSAFMTILASFGGGSYAVAHSILKYKGKVDPSDLINGVLGSLVGITGNLIPPKTRVFLLSQHLFLFAD